MTKLDTLFSKFLSNIEPNEKAVAYAVEAHKPLREYLGSDATFGQYFVNSFLYGSYKRHTAVDTIKDVDIVILTNFNPESEEHTPDKVLRKLKSTLARYYKDPENPEYQRRSIRIDEPLPDQDDCEMTLDIIPAVALNGEDEPLLVPDREVKQWIKSHPKGHIKYSSELNRDNEERFVPLVKIMKWWWKYQCEVRQPKVARPKPKGFWVETLTGLHFDPAQHFYTDHFIALLENVSKKYTDKGEVPVLTDPGLPGELVKTNMDLGEFEVFMQAVNESLELAVKARDETDNLKSSEIWREIFGKEKFPLYSEETKEAKTLSLPLGDYSHAIQPIWQELGSRYSVSIRATICDPETGKFLRELRNDGEILEPNQLIKFFAQTDVPGNYEIYWQVVNTGKHAKQAGALRGERFFKGLQKDRVTENPDQKINYETTKYTGKHWIQCFIVQRGKIIAKSDRFFVNVFNQEFGF